MQSLQDGSATFDWQSLIGLTLMQVYNSHLLGLVHRQKLEALKNEGTTTKSKVSLLFVVIEFY
jgi:hypothetical protein